MTTLRLKAAAACPADRVLAGFKCLLFVACLLPLARAAWIVLSGEAVNPVEFITRSTGTWTLVWLLATLAMTPLRRFGVGGWPLKCRRMLGLFAFFYLSLHFLTYLWLDQFFDWAGIVRDIYKRPFITVGFAALLLMTPLALMAARMLIVATGVASFSVPVQVTVLVIVSALAVPLLAFALCSVSLADRTSVRSQSRWPPGPVLVTVMV